MDSDKKQYAVFWHAKDRIPQHKTLLFTSRYAVFYHVAQMHHAWFETPSRNCSGHVLTAMKYLELTCEMKAYVFEILLGHLQDISGISQKNVSSVLVFSHVLIFTLLESI